MPNQNEPGFWQRQLGNLEQYVQDVLSGDVMRRGILWGDQSLGGGLEGIRQDPMQFVGVGGGTGLLSPMVKRVGGLLGAADQAIPASPRQQYLNRLSDTQQEAQDMINRFDYMLRNPRGRPDLSEEEIMRILNKYDYEAR